MYRLQFVSESRCDFMVTNPP
uniref:Uncharacterized protein n=1 Tax=Anguilla anguilla TaxID=7936 RepID=A0A0E9W7U7_ANGAN